MKQKNENIFKLTLCLMALFTACSPQKEEFNVCGEIKNADKKTLYFEESTLNGIDILDSIKLDKQGHFSFKANRPQNPEFFRIRLGQQIIHLSVDSTENIHILADAHNMGSDYQIEGSEHCITLKRIAQSQMETEKQIKDIVAAKNMTLGEKERRISDLMQHYKDLIKKEFILTDPAAPSSYFALFQTIHNNLVFDPVHNAEDVRWFAAVATAWDNLYPNSTRTENLRNVTLQGQRNTRRSKQIDVEISNEKIKATGIINIRLKDINGQMQSLNERKGKVILLDLTAYALPLSKERIMEMRHLYQRYHDQGLEVYQVSFDNSEHYWKTVCESLPWTCVYDPEGTASENLLLYNVQELPCSFLIDRNNDLKCRITSGTDINKEIEKLL